MTCYRPLQAHRYLSGNGSYEVAIIGKYSSFASQSLPSNFFCVPCGSCVGCRLQYSKNWAIRCSHESSLYEHNSFITLTYNDHFNDRNGGSLNYRDFQLFMKRLRFAVAEDFSSYSFLSGSDTFRFFMCGEYGTRTFRPHFHALFFNLDFGDKELITVRNGFRLFHSDTLSSFWSDPLTGESLGHVAVGSITTESAAYVARYSVKKALNGDQLLHYNSLSGEVLVPEFTRMSRMPGIAKDWFDKFHASVYPEDKVVLNGRLLKPPRYYDLLLDRFDPSLFSKVQESRQDFAMLPDVKFNNSLGRLIVREQIQVSKMSHLPRVL